jgi:hypothetical protein
MLPPASVNSLLRGKPPVSVSVAPDSAIGLLRLQPPESAFFASFASSISLLRLQYQSPSPPVSVSFASRLRYRPPSPPASHIGLLRLQTSVSASFASSLPYRLLCLQTPVSASCASESGPPAARGVSDICLLLTSLPTTSAFVLALLLHHQCIVIPSSSFSLLQF